MQPEQNPPSRGNTWLAGAAYLLMVLLIQGPFLFSSGMGYENVWPWLSETRGFWPGFIYAADPVRPFLTVFYHLSYLVSRLPGLDGSFAAFQLVYAGLWWARAFLVFVILRRVLGGREFLCYLAGALTVVHACDSAFGWVGQIHQPGFIFLMLLGIYLLVLTLQDTSKVRTVLWIVGASACVCLSLWMYESGLFLILLMPVILFCFCPRRRLAGFVVASIAWCGVVAEFVREAAARYLHGAHSYQQSILRKDLGVSTLAGDLWFNVRYTLSFWSWKKIPDIDLSAVAVSLLATGCVVVFTAAGWRIARSTTSEGRESVRTIYWLAAISMVLVVASYPAYLLLAGARTNFRTQFLSGAPASIFLATLVALAAWRARSTRSRIAVSIGLASVIVLVGSVRAMERSAYYHDKWQVHRQAVAQILMVAPQVKPSTAFVLMKVPRDPDPFMNGLWLDAALRLAYPGTPVGGVFFFDDGKAPPGNPYTLDSGIWKVNDSAWAPLLKEVPAGNSLVIEYRAGGAAILPRIPAAVCSDGCSNITYDPESRILRGPPDLRAVKRYGPL